MKGIFIGLLWLGFSLAAWADGMVISTVAYPAHVTIPDQRALIHFTNGTERLVIETRFTGAGTNFAWVVPFPNEPVIEAASTGLFPTLEYLFRPKITHQVTRYYIGILFGLAFLYLFWRARLSVWDGLLTATAVLLLICLAAALLPALSKASSASQGSLASFSDVSILDRKLVGIFETTTLSSRNPGALENWLRANGFALPTNAAPVIAGYVKGGWVFVASKIRRDRPELETSTPHPLSFTFQTVKPVYPMQLTGLNNPSLTVALYLFGNAGATAPHFKVESCKRIMNPLLRAWVGDSTVASKLTATLSPDNMRQDVWLDLAPTFSEKNNRLYSAAGALTTALNWGAGFFAVSLILLCLLAFVSEASHAKFLSRVGIIAILSMLLAGLIYLSLPTTEVKLVKGGRHGALNNVQLELVILGQALDEGHWTTVAEARAIIKATMADPSKSPYGRAAAKDEYGWANQFVGGRFCEEDSPGNYLLRETNRRLELGYYDANGKAEILMKWDLLAPPGSPDTHLK